mgnify:CR=1 FL=1
MTHTLPHSIKLKDLIRNRSYFTQRLKGFIGVLKYLKSDAKKKQYTYPKLVEDRVNEFPNNTIIKYENRKITYSEFNKAANRIAHYLASQGVGKGNVVALFMENRPEYLIYQLAITKLGATVALINNSQKGQVLLHSLNLVKPGSVVVGEEVFSPLADILDDLTVAVDVYRVPDTDTINQPGDDDGKFINIARASYEYPEDNLPVTQTITPDTTAWYIYTSGTTGLPKASTQTHDRMAKAFIAMGKFMNPVKEEDVIYSTLPLYHSTAQATAWFPCVCNGAAFAISRKFSATKFWQEITLHQATGFGYVGELCRYLLNKPAQKEDSLNTVRFVIGNGLRPEIWCEFKERFGIDEVREIYGASEGNLTAFNIFNLDKTVGMILSPHQLVKVDQETEEPIRNKNGRLIKAKKGEPGLLLGEITDEIPFEGYSDKSKNESKVIRGAFKKGDMYFNTGDVLRDIGCKQLQFCDRTGDTFRWKGENVSTGELENIANQHPIVEESVVYGVEIPNTNGKAGMLSVKLKESENKIDGKGLYDFLSENLPSYSIPVFIRIKDEFEKTPTFKYLKTDLKKEGFDLNQVSCPVYVALPGENEYKPLTNDIYASITGSAYRF